MLPLLSRFWWVLLLRGLAAIIFGVAAFAWPGLTLALLVLIFGAYAFVDGVFLLVAVIGGWRQVNDRWLLLIEGLLGIGVGILTLHAPAITAIVLLFYIAVWSLATGVIEIVQAFRLREHVNNEIWLMLGGVASILFAVLLMWSPATGAIALLWVIGTYAILFGLFLIVLAFKMRGLRDRAKEVVGRLDLRTSS
ncbi:MAG TPA: HdeD family acid-resistance protein [Candidatus Binataceae bacterium]|jgi:uncharacterized membrane protein HdeD (DUF308 family)